MRARPAKPFLVLLSLALVLGLVFSTVCFAQGEGDETGKMGALTAADSNSGPGKAKIQNIYDPNRMTETLKKNKYSKAATLRNTSQRPSDWLEDTPLRATT